MGNDDRLLRVGILGCGPISQFAHLESTQKGRNTVLHAVCDVDEGLVRRFGAFYDAKRIYLAYDQMMPAPEVEAVVIGTSDAFHVPAALRALAAGKHVLCEKPIGIDVEEVEGLASAVEKSGLVLQVGHMLRFDPGIESAKAFVDGEMGEMLALKAWYCDSTHRYTVTDAVQPMPRQGTRAMRPSGDPKANRERYYMLAHGSHLVDLARFLAGPIRSVQARLRQRFGAYSWFVDTEFDNGAMGHLDLTVAIRGDWSEGFEIYGQNGGARARIFNPWYYKSAEVDIFHEKEATTTRVLAADGHFYRRQLEGFADSVLTGAEIRGADIHDGIASMKAMAAIMRSVRTGQPVDVGSAGGEI